MLQSVNKYNPLFFGNEVLIDYIWHKEDRAFVVECLAVAGYTVHFRSVIIKESA